MLRTYFTIYLFKIQCVHLEKQDNTENELIAKANYLLKSVEGLGKGITISIGLAYYVIDENFNFDVLFNEADMQAIRAKGKGKNCIIIKE